MHQRFKHLLLPQPLSRIGLDDTELCLQSRRNVEADPHLDHCVDDATSIGGDLGNDIRVDIGSCKGIKQVVLKLVEIVILIKHPMHGLLDLIAGYERAIEEDDLELPIFRVEGEHDVFIRPRCQFLRDCLKKQQPTFPIGNSKVFGLVEDGSDCVPKLGSQMIVSSIPLHDNLSLRVQVIVFQRDKDDILALTLLTLLANCQVLLLL